MTINISQALPFITSIGNYVKQDRIKIVISCLAIGILFAGTCYLIYSRFWQVRQVTKNHPPEKKINTSAIAPSSQTTEGKNGKNIFDEVFIEAGKEIEELKTKLKEAQKKIEETQTQATKFEYEYLKLLEEYKILKAENEQFKIL